MYITSKVASYFLILPILRWSVFFLVPNKYIFKNHLQYFQKLFDCRFKYIGKYIICAFVIRKNT